MASSSDHVFGHYVQSGQQGPLQPLPAESAPLFVAVSADNISVAEPELEAEPGKVGQFHLVLVWAQRGGPSARPEDEADQAQPGSGGATAGGAGKTSLTVKHRTLLMLASYHGSLRVLSYLLSKGADPSRRSPDGLTAFDFAVSGESPNAPAVLAMLKDAESNNARLESLGARSSQQTAGFGEAPSSEAGGFPLTMPLQDEGDAYGNTADAMPYNTAELTRPEYSSDNFRMFSFKVLRCSKRYAHDWRACPFAHPTENARRRDPREFKYCSIACPDYKQGFCIRGDKCPYAHGVFECWLHPSRYRTQLCKDGVNCHRPVCFFAHSLPELRTPTYTWVPTAEDLLRPVPGMMPGTPSTVPIVAAAAAAAAAAGSVYGGAADMSGGAQDGKQDGAGAYGGGKPELDLSAASLMRGKAQGGPQSMGHGGGMMMKGRDPAMPSDMAGVKVGMAAFVGPGGPVQQPQMQAQQMFAFTAPRMSNAFARRHGLNPKDNPMLNLQKIALQSQMLYPALATDSPGAARAGMPASNGQRQRKLAYSQQHNPQVLPPAAYGYPQAMPQQLGASSASHGGPHSYADPSALAAQIAALNLQHPSAFPGAAGHIAPSGAMPGGFAPPVAMMHGGYEPHMVPAMHAAVVGAQGHM